jgi:hypothetical protein
MGKGDAEVAQWSVGVPPACRSRTGSAPGPVLQQPDNTSETRVGYNCFIQPLTA